MTVSRTHKPKLQKQIDHAREVILEYLFSVTATRPCRLEQVRRDRFVSPGPWAAALCELRVDKLLCRRGSKVWLAQDERRKRIAASEPPPYPPEAPVGLLNGCPPDSTDDGLDGGGQ